LDVYWLVLSTYQEMFQARNAILVDAHARDFVVDC
jgi:hypothetical protein